MKKPLFSLLCLLSLTAFSQQRTIETSPFAVVERGEHHRRWQSVTTEIDETGKSRYQTNSYTELETGMHYQKDGQWLESSEAIEIVPDGAVARRGRHQVIFAANCNSPVAIDMLTADGKRLQSRVLGLAYFDTSSGQSVLIAEIQDSIGQVLSLSPNQVIYIDAFEGIKAHLRYTYTKAGFEQDVILRQQPPSPAKYNLNPTTTMLQVLTEFFDAPVPVKEQKTVNGMSDEALDFGDMKVGRGKAFSLLGDASVGSSIPVVKSWGTLEGRTFLVEELPYQSIQPKLESLPRTAAVKVAPDGVLHTVSNKRLLPNVKMAKKPAQPMKLASAPLLNGDGVVLDYVTMTSSNNYTFQGDTTYYVSGSVSLSGTTTIEGGAVIKYTNLSTAKLSVETLICKTGPYRPAIFTSKDDNTVGQTINGSTGNPTNSNGATFIRTLSQNTYKYLRMSYAGMGINPDDVDSDIWHCQFFRCGTAVSVSTGGYVTFHNLLFANCGTAIATGYTAKGEHVTADQVGTFLATGSGNLTNSILTAVTNYGVTRYNCVTNSNGTGIYQVVGAASYYLVAGSTNRNAGTTNINASLGSDLKKLTTYPPLELTNNFITDSTLSPQAGRDTDTPDLGYHYDPLDYVVSGRVLTNSTLTLTNGAAIGTYGSSSGSGISITTGGNLVSEGSPATLNHIVRYNTVQEQSTTNWSATTVANCVNIAGGTSPVPQGSFRFTDWSIPGGQGDHFKAYASITTPFVFKDCQFGQGAFESISCVAITNCLFERVNILLYDNEEAISFYSYNSLYRGGILQLYMSGSSTWIFKDNLFDKTTITQGATVTHSNNGYLTNCNRLSPTNVNDKLLTTMNYTNGPLGSYYYPTNGSSGGLTNLFDAGSRYATNAGLYHYTVTTNQVKEAGSTVDIGFHYVAVTNGVPIDTDGDGVPDYLEDRNGNGTADSGETDWTTYNSGNGLTSGTDLRVYTPLR